MIWALIIGGLMTLFGGGSQIDDTYFIEMKKEVRQIVEDGSRRREAVSLAEDMRKMTVKTQKLKADGLRDFYKIINKGEDPRTYATEILLNTEKLKEYRQSFLEARIGLAEILTPGEWQ